MIDQRIAFALAYLIAATSATLASLYGFMSASGYFGIAKGAGLFFVALIGCHGPAWTVRLYRDLGWGAATFGAIVTVACFAVTLLGGVGTVSNGTATMLAGQTKVASDTKRDADALARLTAERAAMQFQPISVEGVDAARATAATAESVRTAECGTGRGQQCRNRELEELKARDALTIALGNRAATARAEQTDQQIADLRKRLDGAQATVATDSQASSFAQLTGLTVDTAAALYALLFSVALELAAMFALLVAHSRPVAATSQLAASSEPSEPAAPLTALPAPLEGAVRASGATVARFMMACLPRHEGSKVEASAVYRRFVQWCEEQTPAVEPMPPVDFARAFRGLCERGQITVRHDGARAYCEGVRLVG